ncbi:MAG TPA: 23S rRNA (guanosine(2251)-2'-O)-methyltransferase RlmB [Terriglobales bacterium]|nr:23S rRNA (guanosine(2251)-2'-O)-methyltransferase RlmB [Terriglobales bacterium]
MPHVIYGIHAVEEAVRSRARSLDYVGVVRERTNDTRVKRLLEGARANNVIIRTLDREQVAKLARTDLHQGVIAVGGRFGYTDVPELLARRRGDKAFLVILDGIEDPHNLGAIIRTADAAGVDGVVVPERRAAGVTGTVAKASAGASEHVPIARVTNIARTIEELKQHNVWTIGLDERGTQSYDEIDYRTDCAIVLGAEGRGLHDLVGRKCDFLVSIPMLGHVPSLNVSVAAAVVMYEAARQRRSKKQ